MHTETKLKTIEFKIKPTEIQEKILREYSNITTAIWNTSRALYIERQAYVFWENAYKHSELKPPQETETNVFYKFYVNTIQKSAYVQYDGVPRKNKEHSSKLSDRHPWEFDKTFIDSSIETEDTEEVKPKPKKGKKKEYSKNSQLFCRISSYNRNLGKEFLSCPLPLPETPKLRDFTWQTLVTKLRTYPDTALWRQKTEKGRLVLPSSILVSTAKAIAKAWGEYKNVKNTIAAKPRFRDVERQPKQYTLINADTNPVSVNLKKATFIVNGFTMLGELKIVGNKWRARIAKIVGKEDIANCKDETKYTSDLFREVSIVKKESGWYLQIVYRYEAKVLEPKYRKVVGIDVGLQYLYTDDANKTVDNPKYYRKAEERLGYLQRKLQRQEDACKASKAKRAERRNLQKTLASIRLLHEKVKTRRKAYLHKQSTFLTRRSDVIFCEDIKVSNLSRRPKPKKKEDGTGWDKNNAAAKSGLNKSFADAGIGTFIEMLKTKGGDKVIPVNPAYTSQECPQCHTIVKKALSQRTHECHNCGYVTDRDHAAAQIIKQRGLDANPHIAEQYKLQIAKDVQLETYQASDTGQLLLNLLD